MPKTKYVIMTLLLVLLGVVVWNSLPNSSVETQPVAEERRFVQVQVGETTLEAVVSQTPEQIVQGLSDRKDIGADAMLFVLPQRGSTGFWMYRMRFPLDFIWIADGQVVDLHQNIPAAPAGTPEQEIPRVLPQTAVDSVLEVPAGFIQEKGIQRGMKVTLDQVSEVRPWH